MAQSYSFGIADTAMAEAAGVTLYDLHTDVDAICRAYEAVEPVARRLGAEPPRPRLAGMAYPHVSTIGAEVKITSNSVEP